MSYSFHIFFCICLLILSSVCFSISTRCSVDEAVRPAACAQGLGGSCGAAPGLCSSQLPFGARGGPWGPVVTGSLCPWGWAQGSLPPAGHGGPVTWFSSASASGPWAFPPELSFWGGVGASPLMFAVVVEEEAWHHGVSSRRGRHPPPLPVRQESGLTASQGRLLGRPDDISGKRFHP